MTATMEKIAALLAKAERTDNPHEAEAYFEKAQQLATRDAIDIEKARALNGGKSTSKLTSKLFDLGAARTFGLHTHVKLFYLIAYANDVQTAVAQNSTRIYAYGYDTDIEVVETLFNSLLLQMIGESEKYIRKGTYKTETVWREGYWENYGGSRGREWVPAGYKPVHGSTARISFKDSFADRVGQRLREARRNALREPEVAGTGAELVLVNKASTVKDFYDRVANVSGSYGGGKGMTHSGNAIRAGREAAERANIGNGSVSGSKGQIR